MTPNNIVGMAQILGLSVFAVADHNTARNLPALRKLAEAAGLLFIPAMEITTAEERQTSFTNMMKIALGADY